MAAPSVLLVEGVDDKHVVRHLLEHHGLNTFDIKDKEGLPNLLETLPVELRASDLERLGVVVDADVPMASRWQSLSSRLTGCGYTGIPDAPDPAGAVLHQEGKPAVGIWVMPDNSVDGMLEDFVAHLIPPADTLWPQAQNCVDSIPAEHRRFPEPHGPKAKIHTWLAWQEEPGVRMGAAINRRYLSADSEQATAFVHWLRRLLSI